MLPLSPATSSLSCRRLQRAGACSSSSAIRYGMARLYQQCSKPQRAGRALLAAARAAETGGDDDDLLDLEGRLQSAIAREDFALAAKLRDQIRFAQEDVEISVKYANSKFYRAFEKRSYPEMMKVWGHGDHVCCIHPGSNCLYGRDQVMQSWDMMFDGPGRMKVVVQEVRVHHVGSLAFVTCVEVMDAGETTGRLAATNIFERQEEGGAWLLIHHQACPAPPP